MEDEKFKVNFSYIVNSRLETLPHKVGRGRGGKRREAEGDGEKQRRTKEEQTSGKEHHKRAQFQVLSICLCLLPA